MSKITTVITEEISKYIKENFSADDDFLKNLKQQAIENQIPEIFISPDQARFIQFLIKACNIKNALEIGTLAGYSAIVIARALPDDGKLISLELNRLHADFAKQKVKEANLEHKIEIINQYALDYLALLEDKEQFDMFFIDADKINYINYLVAGTNMLRKGGLFIADNALAFGYIADNDPKPEPEHRAEDVKAVQEFNQFFIKHKDYFTCLVTTGDGMLIGIKK